MKLIGFGKEEITNNHPLLATTTTKTITTTTTAKTKTKITKTTTKTTYNHNYYNNNNNNCYTDKYNCNNPSTTVILKHGKYSYVLASRCKILGVCEYALHASHTHISAKYPSNYTPMLKITLRHTSRNSLSRRPSQRQHRSHLCLNMTNYCPMKNVLNV